MPSKDTKVADKSNGSNSNISNDASSEPLPEGWTVHLDPDSGCEYFFHAATGQSTWERPKPPSTLPSPPPRPVPQQPHNNSSFVVQEPTTKRDGLEAMQSYASNLKGMLLRSEAHGTI